MWRDLFLKPEHFSSVHFKIVPFDQYELNYCEDPTVKDGVMTLLHNGLFTFIGTDNKKYAFLSVTNMRKSVFVNEAMYDVAACCPITKIFPFKSNIFISHKHFIHNLPYHTSYDLDGKHKFVSKVYTEHHDTGPLKVNKTVLELESGFFLNKNSNSHSDKFQIHKTFELTKNGVGANGFYYNTMPLKTVTELEDIKLTFADQHTDYKTFADRCSQKINTQLIQILLRFLKFKPNALSRDKNLTIITVKDAEILSESILLKETDDGGVFANCFRFDDFEEEKDDDGLDDFQVKRPKLIKKNVELDNEPLNFHIGSNQSIKRFNQRVKNK